MLEYAGIELFWVSVLIVLPVVCVILWQKHKDRKMKTVTIIDMDEFRRKLRAANMPNQSFGFNTATPRLTLDNRGLSVSRVWWDTPSTEYLATIERDNSIFKTVEEFRNELDDVS
jgi:hypothetical protein